MDNALKKTIAAGVLPICINTGRLMLIRRGFNQGGANTWAFFGGKFEENIDSSPKETAKREFKEESGLNLRYSISSMPFYINDDNFLRFYSFIGLFDCEFIPDLTKEDESQDYGWFYLDELPDGLLPGVEETFNNKYDFIKKIINKNFENE